MPGGLESKKYLQIAENVHNFLPASQFDRRIRSAPSKKSFPKISDFTHSLTCNCMSMSSHILFNFRVVSDRMLKQPVLSMEMEKIIYYKYFKLKSYMSSMSFTYPEWHFFCEQRAKIH